MIVDWDLLRIESLGVCSLFASYRCSLFEPGPTDNRRPWGETPFWSTYCRAAESQRRGSQLLLRQIPSTAEKPAPTNDDQLP